MASELVFSSRPYVADGALKWSVCNEGDAPSPLYAVVGRYSVWDRDGNTEYLAETDYQAHTEIGPRETYDAGVALAPLVLLPGSYAGVVRIQAPYHDLDNAYFDVRGSDIVPR